MAKEKEEPVPKAPVFCGVAVMVDLAGPVMKAVSARYDNLECAARLNFRDHFFPIFELGYGESDRDGEKNSNNFKTSAPYFRIGMDYNIKKLHNGNRLFLGARFGFTSYKYDFTNDEFTDPVWQTDQAGLYLKDQKTSMQWAEICVGCETKLWSFLRLGWTMRFKVRAHQGDHPYGDPYYAPGYGKNGGTTWGGTCNLVFDVGKTSKKNDKK